MRPVSERRRYNVTSSLIGRAHSQNDLWKCTGKMVRCIPYNVHTMLFDFILPRLYIPIYVKLYDWLTVFCKVTLTHCSLGGAAVIPKLLIFRNSSVGARCGIALMWMPQNFTSERSTLFQEMAWRGQITSHYLNQCWLGSKSPNGVTMSVMTLKDMGKIDRYQTN